MGFLSFFSFVSFLRVDVMTLNYLSHIVIVVFTTIELRMYAFPTEQMKEPKWWKRNIFFLVVVVVMKCVKFNRLCIAFDLSCCIIDDRRIVSMDSSRAPHMDHLLKLFLFAFVVFWWREHEFLVCMSFEHHRKTHPQCRKWVTTPDQICAILFCGETTAKIHSKPWIYSKRTQFPWCTDTYTPKHPNRNISMTVPESIRNILWMGVWLCVVEQCLWTIYAYHELNKNKSTALMFIYHFGTINNHFVRMLNSISVGYSLCFHIIRGRVMHFCVAFVVMCAMCGFEYIRHLFWCCHHCVCVWLVVYSFFGQIYISDRSTRI